MCSNNTNENCGRQPFISCVMPTYGRPDYVNEAIAMFLAQDYPHKELVILNDCPEQKFHGDLPGVRVFNAEQRYRTLGEKRNAAIQLAQGDVIAIWDDDDIYLPWRLSFSWQEMQRLAVDFYRPAEFWAYWGEEDLHDNQATEGWVSHALIMFTKSIWRSVGGYPPQSLNEDAVFFQRIHETLNQSFVAHPLNRNDRFFVLRGKSKYKHMCMEGGESPLDLTPGHYELKPNLIADTVLRQRVDQIVETRKPFISVCIALKNRSRLKVGEQMLELFPNSVRALAQAAEALADLGSIELVVADFHSDDWPLEAWLRELSGPLQVKVVSLDSHFSRGKGLNAAIEQATSDRLFLSDADMLVRPEAVQRAVALIDSGQAWCPTYECLNRQGQPEFWQDLSHGMVALHRDWYVAAGLVPEFESWGGEDDLFHESLAQQVTVVRERSPHLQHQWHPESSRHENYANPRKSDYLRHIMNLNAKPTHGAQPTHRFYAVHPYWEGEIHCFANGRMMRPGIDFGTYELNSERIVLNWNQWPSEALDWDEATQAYRHPAKEFSLRTIEPRCDSESNSTWNPSLASLTKAERDGLNDLADVAAMLDRLNVRWSLQGGSVLGWFRSGGFLPHESDIDLTVLAEDWTPTINIEAAALGFQVQVYHQGHDDNGMHYHWRREGHAWHFDVYPTHQATILGKRLRYNGGDRYWRYYFPPSMVEQTKQVDLLGVSVHVPREAEAYLEWIYGDDFQTPIPDAKWDWVKRPRARSWNVMHYLEHASDTGSSEDFQFPPEKKTRIYVDAVCDLFHGGHIEAFIKARALASHPYLIVGLNADEDVTYKEPPTLSLEERLKIVGACRYVDEVMVGPLPVSAEFLRTHQIDLVVHGDDISEESRQAWYADAIAQGIYREVPYEPGISSRAIRQRVRSFTNS